MQLLFSLGMISMYSLQSFNSPSIYFSYLFQRLLGVGHLNSHSHFFFLDKRYYYVATDKSSAIQYEHIVGLALGFLDPS